MQRYLDSHKHSINKLYQDLVTRSCLVELPVSYKKAQKVVYPMQYRGLRRSGIPDDVLSLLENLYKDFAT